MADTLRARLWLIAIFLTLAWHIILFMMPWSLLFPHTTKAPQPIALRSMSADQLNQLKQQWKSKSLLLRQNLKAQSEKPKNARYLSDKNASVKKEQRAKRTRVTPRKQRGGQPQNQSASKSRFPELSSLGVPMKLDPSRVRPQGERGTPQDAADQAIEDSSLPMGGENLLNSEQSVFYSYYARLYEEVGPPWESRIRAVTARRNLPPGDYIAQVDVVFDEKGNLIEVNFIKSSMDPELDAAIVQTWRKIRRFPNPPKELLNEQGQVHTGWTFTVHISDDFRLQYRAPRRNY